VSPYGESKLFVERALARFGAAHGLRYAALRYFNAAGADAEGELGEDHEPETHLIPLVIGAAQGRRPRVSIFGTDYPTPDGTAVRDYVHVSDLATAHVSALRHLAAGGESLRLNLGTGQGHSVREVIRTVEEVSGRVVPVREAPRRRGDPPELVAASGRAREILEWSPRHSDLRNIIATAWQWHAREDTSERAVRGGRQKPPGRSFRTRHVDCPRPPIRSSAENGLPRRAAIPVRATARASRAVVAERPVVRGKFPVRARPQVWIKGVTYGSISPPADGHQFPDFPRRVERDFAQMCEAGINTVRVLHGSAALAARTSRNGTGSRSWSGCLGKQHDRRFWTTCTGELDCRGVCARCAELRGIPRSFCYASATKSPPRSSAGTAGAVVERFIERLYRFAKKEDPGALVTYVNFPTTEYLRLPFLDFHCFNVYLDRASGSESYLARLQNLAGEKPLLMAEIGLDSRRNGPAAQAESLDWQIRTAFAAGCVGAFAFAWTDEWHRGGLEIEDWDFGLTTRTREPKPALAAASRAFAEVPFPPEPPNGRG
jgi:hypothetical protein